MSKDEIIATCKWISKECKIPFDDLWKDDGLTYTGGLLVVFTFIAITQGFLSKICNNSNDSNIN